MPLCTLYLLSLHSTRPASPLKTFLTTLQTTSLTPLVISRVIRWVILPTTFSTDHLLARNIHWDILLILPGTPALPSVLQSLIQHQWSITAGVPSRLAQDFAQKNDALLRSSGATPTFNPPHTTSSAQALELSADLAVWIKNFLASGTSEARGAVSMFNLLSFRPGMKASYLEYGKAFAASIGKNHGGNAKIVGGVTNMDGVARDAEKGDGLGWDEITLAHYPSIAHFAEMLVDEEYQAVNHKHRVPALRDTAILMTSEVGIREMMDEGAGLKGRL